MPDAVIYHSPTPELSDEEIKTANLSMELVGQGYEMKRYELDGVCHFQIGKYTESASGTGATYFEALQNAVAQLNK